MRLWAWLEKPVSGKRSASVSAQRNQDYFSRQVADILRRNENEFNRGASRDQRLVAPAMVELLP